MLWAFLAVLLAWIFWLLLGACGVRPLAGPPALFFCPERGRGPDAAVAAEVARQHALGAEIERLELALLARPACAPAPPAAAGAGATPEAGEAIPEAAWRERDVGFLEGCWQLDTDYAVRNIDTGVVNRVGAWQVCFEGGGAGRQELVFDNDSRCRGPMRGEFAPDGRLVLKDQGDVPCDGGVVILERHVTCERVDADYARCESVGVGDGSRAPVTFRREAAGRRG